MIARFIRDTSGAAAPLMASGIAAGALLLVLTLTQVMDHLHKRELQATADLIALIAVRDQDYSLTRARAVLSDQGFDPDRFDIVVEPGLYQPAPEREPHERFRPRIEPYNAAHVELRSVNTSRIRAGDRQWRARAEATAARQDMVSFAIASRLVRLEGGYSGAVLAAIIAGSAAPDVVLGALSLGQAATLQRQINFTRNHELEADRIGIGNLIDASKPEAAPGLGDFRMSGLPIRFAMAASDCASPPTSTLPTRILRETRRSIARQGLTLV